MAKSLRELRKSRKLTIKALAEKAGCSPNTISEYETNPPPTVDGGIIERLAACLDVTAGYILSLMGSAVNTSSIKKEKKSEPKAKAKPDKTVVYAPQRAVRKKESQKVAGVSRKTNFTRRKANLVFTARQRTVLTGLLDERIHKLRAYALEASRSSEDENKALHELAQAVLRDINDLEEIKISLLGE